MDVDLNSIFGDITMERFFKIWDRMETGHRLAAVVGTIVMIGLILSVACSAPQAPAAPSAVRPTINIPIAATDAPATAMPSPTLAPSPTSSVGEAIKAIPTPSDAAISFPFPAETTVNANFRKEAKIDSRVLTVVPAGTVVTVIGQEGEYWQAELQTADGVLKGYFNNTVLGQPSPPTAVPAADASAPSTAPTPKPVIQVFMKPGSITTRGAGNGGTVDGYRGEIQISLATVGFSVTSFAGLEARMSWDSGNGTEWKPVNKGGFVGFDSLNSGFYKLCFRGTFGGGYNPQGDCIDFIPADGSQVRDLPITISLTR